MKFIGITWKNLRSIRSKVGWKIHIDLGSGKWSIENINFLHFMAERLLLLSNQLSSIIQSSIESSNSVPNKESASVQDRRILAVNCWWLFKHHQISRKSKRIILILSLKIHITWPIHLNKLSEKYFSIEYKTI